MRIMASAESWERWWLSSLLLLLLLRTGEGKVVFAVLVVAVVVGVVSGCRLRKTSLLLLLGVVVVVVVVVMVQLFWRSRLSNMSPLFLFLSRKCGKKGDPGGSDMGDAKLRGECGMPVAVDMVIMTGGGG